MLDLPLVTPSKLVTDHRLWPRHQAVHDPKHVTAVKALRRERVGLNMQGSKCTAVVVSFRLLLTRTDERSTTAQQGTLTPPDGSQQIQSEYGMLRRAGAKPRWGWRTRNS